MSEVADSFPAFVPSPARPPAPPNRARVHGWQPAGRLTCPVGHVTTHRNDYLGGSFLVRCTARAGAEVCGAHVLAVVGTPLIDFGHPEERLVYTIEVTSAEARFLASEKPPLLWILEHFGAVVRPAL